MLIPESFLDKNATLPGIAKKCKFKLWLKPIIRISTYTDKLGSFILYNLRFHQIGGCGYYRLKQENEEGYVIQLNHLQFL